jgi:hypothetical protein
MRRLLAMFSPRARAERSQSSSPASSPRQQTSPTRRKSSSSGQKQKKEAEAPPEPPAPPASASADAGPSLAPASSEEPLTAYLQRNCPELAALLPAQPALNDGETIEEYIQRALPRADAAAHAAARRGV